VSVCDRGPGIPDRDRKRIFEPFERGAGPVAGTGLGLTISNAIVAAHGGRMWVSETPGGGSAFTFELPRPDGVDGEVSDAGASARR
jgi:signal transduction histidine kinase